MDSARSTSSLLQLIDGLNRCIDPEHHTRLICEALEGAGLVDVPDERDAFRAFVSGALETAASALIGETVAKELTWTLMRMTSVRAPSSKSPRSERFVTAEYTDDVFAPRPDVTFFGPEGTLFDELRIHIEARGYRVERIEDDAPGRFRAEHLPRMLVTQIELERALRCAEVLRRDYGTQAPAVVVLTDQAETPERPDGVDGILSTDSLPPIVAAVLRILGAPIDELGATE